MKKWFFSLAIGGVIIYICMQFMSTDIKLLQLDPKERSSDGVTSIQIKQDQIYSGSLILVNRDHPLHTAGIAADIISVSNLPTSPLGYSAASDDIKLSQQVLAKFQTMVEAAQADDKYHFILTSGYRDKTKQAALFQEMGADYALPPGFSEHNIGISIDIGSAFKKMEQASEAKWLQRNSWNFGFILRYPTDKTEITGIQYEPWHFRYVGLPHSLIMEEKNWVLEEYIDYLQQNNSLKVQIGGIKYELHYHVYEDGLTIEVPIDGRYEVSGDNMGGIIVTIEI